MSIDIQTLIVNMEWAKANELAEVVLTIDGAKVKICRTVDQGHSAPTIATVPDKMLADGQATEAMDLVTAPMAGLCHLSAEKNALPFVAVGDSVESGQTVCIVEAMKVMTNIHAPCSGTVDAILVDDGASVNTGTALLRLR